MAKLTLKHKKVLTPEEKYKLELQTETELLRLQRQYRILESDRHILLGGTTGHQKHNKVIEVLRKEYNEILTDLAVAASESNAKTDKRIADSLSKLLNEHNHFVCSIKREKAYLQELDSQITMTKKRIIDLKPKAETEVHATKRINDQQRTLEALENKLETATKRFCTTIAENRKLRQEIDHLLREQELFNKMWDRLVTNLSHGKKFMLDLIEQATIAYDQREEWCQKLQTLRTRAYNEYLAHTQEMTDMQRQIDDESKLQDFLLTKGQKRIMKSLLQKEQERREMQRQEMQQLLENYSAMLEQIKEFMGDPSLERVCEKFTSREMDNFYKFKYINELNRELEQLTDELVQLQFKIDEQRGLHRYREVSQQEKLETLEAELLKVTDETLEAESVLRDNRDTLQALLDGIGSLFDLCKCTNEPLLELLGNNTSINKYNALLYLKILENRINEMIIGVYYKEKKEQKRGSAHNKIAVIKPEKVKHQIVSIDDLVNKDPCPLCVEQAMVSDVIDTLQRIMDKDEIKVRLEEAIEKRGFNEVVHNVSGCHLPKSREIMQKRYQ